jgi:hypothetical protein
MFSLSGAIVCNSRHMFPRTGFWLGYLGYLLHFVGGSLGEDDWQPTRNRYQDRRQLRTYAVTTHATGGQ